MQITVSNALDEYLIRDLLLQGARVDGFGVGERMITASSQPVSMAHSVPRARKKISASVTTASHTSSDPARRTPAGSPVPPADSRGEHGKARQQLGEKQGLPLQGRLCINPTDRPFISRNTGPWPAHRRTQRP